MSASRTAKVLILSSGQALTALVGLLSVAILTRILTKEDFGSYRQAMLAFTFATPFVILGLDRALYTFLPGETERPRGLLVENLFLLSIAGGVLSLFIIFGGDTLLAQRFNNPALASLIALMTFYPLFLLPATATSSCLMARNRTGQLAVFNVLSRLTMFLFIIIPCFFLPRSSTAILGNVVGVIFTTAVAVYLMLRACPGTSWHPTWAGIKQQLSFSIPLGLATIVGTTTVTLDQVLVSLRCSPEVFAVYTVGAMEIPLIGIITGSITSVVLVDYARFYREGNLSAIITLVHKAMIKSAILILPVMTFLLCIAPELIRLLFGKSYEWSAVPFRIYLLNMPIRTITFGAILLATQNSRYILINQLLALAANAIFGWTLIGVFGAAGAAIGAVLASYVIGVPHMILVISNKLKTRAINLLPWMDMVKLLVISLVPALAISILKLLITLADIYWILLALIIYLPVILIGYLSAKVIDKREFKNIVQLKFLS